MKKVYIIHENDEWTDHLTKRLDELQVPYEAWHLDQGTVNLAEAPPEGIFYSRMSASSHTRGHRYAPELAAGVIAWLEKTARSIRMISIRTPITTLMLKRLPENMACWSLRNFCSCSLIH